MTYTEDCQSLLYNIPSDNWKTGFGILFLMFSVVGTAENFIVLLVLYKFKPLHRVSNIILASLAMSDFLASSILAPIFVSQLLNEGFSRNCRFELVRRYLAMFFLGASVFTIALVSYDRYLHLTKLQGYNMTMRKAGLLIFSCWFMPSLMPFSRGLDESETVYSVTVIITLVLMLGVISICYILIVWALYQHGKLQTNEILTAHAKERRLKAGRTVIVILSCYIFMVLPVSVHMITTIVDKDKPEKEVAVGYIIEMSLCLLNSTINPIIYYFRTPNLKCCVKKLLGIRKRSIALDNGQIQRKMSAFYVKTSL